MTACQNVTTIITLAISMFFNKVLLNVTIPSNSNGFAPKSVISNSLFPQNCSLSISTLSSSLHRFKFSFKILIFQNCMNSEKKSEETFFNYVFQKIFRLIQKICTNNTRNLLHFSTGFKIRELLVISHYYLIYRLFFQISSVFLLSISDSRSNPGSFIK